MPDYTYTIIDVPNFKNYIKQAVNHNKIVIHGTYGGTVDGAIQTFKTGAKGVATHFIISLDAKIYRLFPELYFAYHAGGDFRTISQTSFGILIVNWLNLKLINGIYRTWTNKIIPALQVKIVPSWRGATYFHKVTLAQHDALTHLLKYLCLKYNIPKKFYRDYSSNSIYNSVQFSGILQHSSFHPTRLDFLPHLIEPITI